MKKGLLTFLALLVLATAIIVSYKINEPQNNNTNVISPFIGMWEWVETIKKNKILQFGLEKGTIHYYSVLEEFFMGG